MGDKFRTLQNLEIIKSDLENNLIFVKGSVPGSKNSIVLIQKNAKKIKKITTLEKIKKIQTQSSSIEEKSKKKSKAPDKKEDVSKKPEKKEVKK
jgi:Ribosomal protein L3